METRVVPDLGRSGSLSQSSWFCRIMTGAGPAPRVKCEFFYDVLVEAALWAAPNDLRLPESWASAKLRRQLTFWKDRHIEGRPLHDVRKSNR